MTPREVKWLAKETGEIIAQILKPYVKRIKELEERLSVVETAGRAHPGKGNPGREAKRTKMQNAEARHGENG